MRKHAKTPQLRGLLVTAARAVLAALILAAAALPFGPGLGGPFLLDDLPNFDPLLRWSAGEITARAALTELPAGPLGRPISLLSFMVTLATSGPAPQAFKATSLAIHLATAVALSWLLREVLEQAGRKAAQARNWAVALALIWTVLPIHVPTVLYAVQRMTLLSGMFTVLALLAYVLARRRMVIDGSTVHWLVMAVPLLSLAAALSKENGILALPLCLVLELTLFSGATLSRTPTTVAWFFRITVIWPGLLTLGYLALHPNRILDGYLERPFTLEQRLLTEPRALWSYFWNTFVPSPGFISIYQDTFAPSSTLLSPPTTALAIMGCIAAFTTAVALRTRQPLISAGIGIFLVGHSLEGSIFPLELFFSHRNYIPSTGLVVLIAGLASVVMDRLPAQLPYRRFLAALPALALFHYAVATASYSATWGNKALLYASELQQHPDSLRLRADLGAEAMEAQRSDIAMTHFDVAFAVASPMEKRAVRLWQVMARCRAAQAPLPQAMNMLARTNSVRINSTESRAINQLADDIADGTCDAAYAAPLAQALQLWLATTPQSQADQRVWQSHYAVARILATAGDVESASTHAMIAFENSGWQPPVGAFAFSAFANLRDFETCRKILGQLRVGPNHEDQQTQTAITHFEKLLQNEAYWKCKECQQALENP